MGCMRCTSSPFIYLVRISGDSNTCAAWRLRSCSASACAARSRSCSASADASTSIANALSDDDDDDDDRPILDPWPRFAVPVRSWWGVPCSTSSPCSSTITVSASMIVLILHRRMTFHVKPAKTNRAQVFEFSCKGSGYCRYLWAMISRVAVLKGVPSRRVFWSRASVSESTEAVASSRRTTYTVMLKHTIRQRKGRHCIISCRWFTRKHQ